MRNKIIALLLILSLFTMSGCQLAIENYNDNSNDRLVGAFITTEYLNLSDFEAQFANGNYEIENGNLKFQDNSGSGRLYAQLVDGIYKFPGYEGYSCFIAEVTQDYGETTVVYTDEIISDPKLHSGSTDNGESIEISGTIYLTPKAASKAYYINPVYQSPDGAVYAVSGSGISNGSDMTGSDFSTKLTADTAKNENGKTESFSSSIEIVLKVVNEPGNIRILEMDSDNNIISKKSYTPAEVPDKITTNKNTEYIIIETELTTSENGKEITRKLYNKTDTDVSVLIGRDDGLIMCKNIEVW